MKNIQQSSATKGPSSALWQVTPCQVSTFELSHEIEPPSVAVLASADRPQATG